MKIIVTILVIAAIVFIAWWFLKKDKKQGTQAVVNGENQAVTINVDGGYTPETVVLKKGVPATLNFYRKDPSTCLEEVVFSDFGIKEKLPQNKTQAIQIDTSHEGEFEYACGMNMYHGKVIIK